MSRAFEHKSVLKVKEIFKRSKELLGLRNEVEDFHDGDKDCKGQKCLLVEFK